MGDNNSGDFASRYAACHSNALFNAHLSLDPDIACAIAALNSGPIPASPGAEARNGTVARDDNKSADDDMKVKWTGVTGQFGGTYNMSQPASFGEQVQTGFQKKLNDDFTISAVAVFELQQNQRYYHGQIGPRNSYQFGGQIGLDMGADSFAKLVGKNQALDLLNISAMIYRQASGKPFGHGSDGETGVQIVDTASFTFDKDFHGFGIAAYAAAGVNLMDGPGSGYVMMGGIQGTWGAPQ